MITYSLNAILLLVTVSTCLSQPLTPKCTSVITYYTISENSQAWIDAMNAEAQAQYPNATLVDDASATYNCHGYAWHSSNGGTRYWINTPGDDVYWTDGSYTQVIASPATPLVTKVSYYSDDHSAVTTVNSNLFISKWGQWPLMQHAPTYTPYNSSTLKYYAVPITTGASLICYSSAYQTIIPSTGTINYSWSAGAYLTPSSQTGSSNYYYVSKTGNGDSYINVQITSSCSGLTVSARKNVRVGALTTSEISVNGQVAVCPGNIYTYVANHPGGVGVSYSWTYPSGWSVQGQYQNQITLYVPQYGTQYGTVRVSVDNGCGASGYTGVTVYPAYSCGGGYIYSYYPNPAKDKLTVEVFDQSDGKPLDVGLTIPFMTYIYDGRQKELMHAESNANKAVLIIL